MAHQLTPYWIIGVSVALGVWLLAMLGSGCFPRIVRQAFAQPLGKAIRKRCSELELPWIACTGSGRASMVRAIEQAILLAWRQGGMALHG